MKEPLHLIYSYCKIVVQKRTVGHQDTAVPYGTGKQGRAGVASPPTDSGRLQRTWHLMEYFWALNCGFHRNIGDIIINYVPGLQKKSRIILLMQSF